MLRGKVLLMQILSMTNLLHNKYFMTFHELESTTDKILFNCWITIIQVFLCHLFISKLFWHKEILHCFFYNSSIAMRGLKL